MIKKRETIFTKRSTLYALRCSRGFTIVEMMVVIAIMTLMAIGMMINNTRFGDNLILNNLAYDISTTIRQAQSYGLSTKNWINTITPSSPNQGFDVGYGIRFASLDSATPGNKKFVMFFEKDNNWHCGLDSNVTLSSCQSSTEGMSNGSYLISGRSEISEICAISASGSLNDCYDFTTSTGQIKYLDIIFKRSDPDAQIEPEAHISTDISVYPNGYQRAEITLLAKTGFTRTVVVTAIGQILVK